jgi:hypothetical protein
MHRYFFPHGGFSHRVFVFRLSAGATKYANWTADTIGAIFVFEANWANIVVFTYVLGNRYPVRVRKHQGDPFA